jgi:hypothetical protein
MNRTLARSLLSLTAAGALLGATGATALADARPQAPRGGGAPVLRLVKLADLAVIGVTGENYGRLVLEQGAWEARYGCAPPTCRRRTSRSTAPRRWARPCPRSRPRTRPPRPDARPTVSAAGWVG